MKLKKEELSLVYITCSSIEEARSIGHILIKENLVACVNILGKVISIFRWEGEIEEANEVLLVVKTRKTLTDRLVKSVRRNHSYDCPCILELPIKGGNSDFLKWVESETL